MSISVGGKGVAHIKTFGAFGASGMYLFKFERKKWSFYLRLSQYYHIKMKKVKIKLILIKINLRMSDVQNIFEV